MFGSCVRVPHPTTNSSDENQNLTDLPYFISYAHDDNAANADWVHRFCDKLIARYRAQTGKKPDIFLDRDGLNTGNVLSDRLQHALNESRVFIPVLSPTYLSSRWCRREFLHFLQQAGDGLIVAGSRRIVPVRLMPTTATTRMPMPPPKWPVSPVFWISRKSCMPIFFKTPCRLIPMIARLTWPSPGSPATCTNC